MKKKFSIILLLFVTTMLFAGTIPEGRNLFVLAWDFGTDFEKSWKSATFDKIDVQNNEYVISGYCVNKNLVGFIKQSYTTTIVGDGNSFTVTVTNMESTNCKKDGTETGSPVKNPSSTMKKLGSLIEADLNDRINKWTPEEYEIKKSKALNPTLVLAVKENSTSLLFKKFVKDYLPEGQIVKTNVKVFSVDESNKDGFAYKIACVYLGKIINTVFYDIYTNKDEALSLNKGDNYTIDGKISSVEIKDHTGSVTVSIEE